MVEPDCLLSNGTVFPCVDQRFPESNIIRHYLFLSEKQNCPFSIWEISALFLYDDDRVGYSIFCYMYSEHNYILSCYEENFPVVCGEHTTHLLHCPKSNPNFRDII